MKHRDWCIEEFAENKKQTVLGQDTMTDLQARLPCATTVGRKMRRSLKKGAGKESKPCRPSKIRISKCRELREVISNFE